MLRVKIIHIERRKQTIQSHKRWLAPTCPSSEDSPWELWSWCAWVLRGTGASYLNSLGLEKAFPIGTLTALATQQELCPHRFRFFP